MTEATPAPAAPAAAPAPVAENPGKGLGIAGLVLAFFVNIVGLILSIVALRKSKKAGFGNGPAVAGIIIASISIVVSIIVIALLVSAGAAVLGAVAEYCTEMGLEAGTYELTDGTTITCP